MCFGPGRCVPRHARAAMLSAQVPIFQHLKFIMGVFFPFILTVFQSLLDVHIGAGVRLIGGAKQTVTLRIRLGAAADEIFRLEAGEPLLEVFMILARAVV